jgi:hypothetical protein
MRCQRRQIVGIVIHVETVAYLCRPTMTSPVMSYDAIAMVYEKQHLCVPTAQCRNTTIVIGRKYKPTRRPSGRISQDNECASALLVSERRESHALTWRGPQYLDTIARHVGTRSFRRLRGLVLGGLNATMFSSSMGMRQPEAVQSWIN